MRSTLLPRPDEASDELIIPALTVMLGWRTLDDELVECPRSEVPEDVSDSLELRCGSL